MPGPSAFPGPEGRPLSRTVLLFALARARAGSATLTVDLADPATVGDLKSAIGRACPALEGLLPHLRIAVDSEYAPDDLAIPPGAELAAIPPVSGGGISLPSRRIS